MVVRKRPLGLQLIVELSFPRAQTVLNEAASRGGSDARRSCGAEESTKTAIARSFDRTMTALRQRYIRDLAIRGKAERTQVLYTSYVAEMARFYGKSPDLLSYDEVADWLFHLLRERKLSKSAVTVAVCAIRFLYGVTLGR